MATGTSPQPLEYAMEGGADGGCKHAVALYGFPLAPNFHTIYSDSWGLTNRLAGERLLGQGAWGEGGNSPKDRVGQGGAHCLQSLFSDAQLMSGPSRVRVREQAACLLSWETGGGMPLGHPLKLYGCGDSWLWNTFKQVQRVLNLTGG